MDTQLMATYLFYAIFSLHPLAIGVELLVVRHISIYLEIEELIDIVSLLKLPNIVLCKYEP